MAKNARIEARELGNPQFNGTKSAPSDSNPLEFGMTRELGHIGRIDSKQLDVSDRSGES
jgi:hypothetical protein